MIKDANEEFLMHGLFLWAWLRFGINKIDDIVLQMFRAIHGYGYGSMASIPNTEIKDKKGTRARNPTREKLAQGEPVEVQELAE